MKTARSILVMGALLPAALFLASTQATAQTGTTASVSEMVSNWGSICFENAGDPTAQRRAAQEIAPPMPIQVQFIGERDDPICVVISAMDGSENFEDLLDAARSTLDFNALSDVREQPNGMSAVATIDSRQFRVSFSTRNTQNFTVAMAVIGEMKASQ